MRRGWLLWLTLLIGACHPPPPRHPLAEAYSGGVGSVTRDGHTDPALPFFIALPETTTAVTLVIAEARWYAATFAPYGAPYPGAYIDIPGTQFHPCPMEVWRVDAGRFGGLIPSRRLFDCGAYLPAFRAGAWVLVGQLTWRDGPSFHTAPVRLYATLDGATSSPMVLRGSVAQPEPWRAWYQSWYPGGLP